MDLVGRPTNQRKIVGLILQVSYKFVVFVSVSPTKVVAFVGQGGESLLRSGHDRAKRNPLKIF